jgi:hypothetical protein
MEFKKHGEFNIKVKGNILFIELFGPANTEAIVEYNNEMERVIETMHFDKWYQIVCIRGQGLLSLQSEGCLMQSLYARKKKGLQKCAMVVAITEGRTMVKSQIERCYQKANIECAFFDDLQSANVWVEKT